MESLDEMLKQGIRFKISSSVIAIVIDDNTVDFRTNATQEILTLRDSSQEGKLGRIIEYLADNYATLGELMSRFNLSEEEAKALIEKLNRAGVLVFDFTNQVGEENPFNDFLNLKMRMGYAPLSGEALQKVYSSRLLLVGINQLSLALVKDLYALTKNVELIDFKSSIEDVTFDGTSASELLDSLKIKYSLYQPYELDLTVKPDVVVVTSEYDNVRMFEEINKRMVESKTKWVLAYIDGTKFYISSFVPPATACYHCGLTMQTAHFSLYKSYKRYIGLASKLNVINVKRRTGLTPFHLKLYAGLIGLEVIELLLTNEGYFTGKEFSVDAVNLEFELTRLLKNPRCHVCSRVLSTPSPFKDTLFD